MEWLTASLQIAIGAGLATTFDDTIYLTGFFSEVDRTFRPLHVVVGEVAGFTVLLSLSLLGFLMGLAVPKQQIGLLGFLPILLGLRGLIEAWQSRGEPDRDQQVSRQRFQRLRGFESRQPSLLEVLRDRRTWSVSLVTISNGSNNLSIYIPLFASLSPGRIAVVVPVLYGFIATWLLLSFHLTRTPGIAVLLNRYARIFFPLILIWLGYRILSDTEALQLLLPALPG